MFTPVIAGPESINGRTKRSIEEEEEDMNANNCWL